MSDEGAAGDEVSELWGGRYVTARVGQNVATDWEARARFLSQELADSRRQVAELEMRLRLSNAREQKALQRAKAADANSARWHAQLLKHQIEAL